MVDVYEELRRKTPGSKEAYERSSEVLGQVVTGTLSLPHPIYIKEAKGSRVTDVDDNEYIDLTMGFGPQILGHAPDVVIEAVKEAADRGLQWALHNPYQEPLARLMVEAVPCAEKVVFVNTGTEATMYAIRAARAITGKSKVGVFDGSYHGAHDYVLVKVDQDSPRDRPEFAPSGDGIPTETQQNVMMLPYRNEAALDLIREKKDELALVMVEGAQSSVPILDGDFLRKVAQVCRESGVLFLMDEVISGFRLAYGGAQEFLDVKPDLATYGKIIGGGMPIGAIAGSNELMEAFSRSPDVYQSEGGEVRQPGIFTAGTFSGNPVTMAAGHAQISYLRDHPEIYKDLAEQGERVVNEINTFCTAEEFPAQMLGALSLFHLWFQREPINSYRDVTPPLQEAEDLFYLNLMNRGVIIPAVHMACISSAHTPDDIDQIITAMKESFLAVKEAGLL